MALETYQKVLEELKELNSAWIDGNKIVYQGHYHLVLSKNWELFISFNGLGRIVKQESNHDKITFYKK